MDKRKLLHKPSTEIKIVAEPQHEVRHLHISVEGDRVSIDEWTEEEYRAHREIFHGRPRPEEGKGE